jgi:signal transduction histidine kinase
MADADAEQATSTDAQQSKGAGDPPMPDTGQANNLARMTAQFRALHDIDVALTSSLQLDRVLNLILEKAVHLVSAEHGSLRLLNPETGNLELKAWLGEGWTPEVRATPFQVGQGITGWVVQNRRSYLCSDAQHDPQYVVLFQDMRSSVAVPLAGSLAQDQPDDEVLGVLFLESARLAAFDAQDVELLEALAQEAVIAILNATQHQRLQAVHQALQSEQARRVAAERWAVMGQAATALAHRINNLIGIVPASAGEIRNSLAGLELPQQERAWIEANLERIERNAQFILKMASALFRPFQETGPRLQLDVNLMLSEALQMACLPPDVEVQRDLDTGLPAVESNLLLQDIFLELITNARRAMADRPVKRLALRSRALEGQQERWVVVEIQDTGTGISPGDMADIWKMFKPTAEGLGFGLWWVRTFIEQQGGTIACHSEPGSGTIFTIRLPGHKQNGPGDDQKERECEARF